MRIPGRVVFWAATLPMVLTLLVLVSIGHAQQRPDPKPDWEQEYRLEQRDTVDHQGYRHVYTVKVRDGVEDVLHGKFTRHYVDGLLAGESWFYDGRLHGTAHSWSKRSSGDRTAEIYIKRDFVEGILHGVHEEHWVQEDTRKTQGMYSSGRKEGTWKFWYRSGQLERTEEYVDDVMHGTESRWHESGQLWWRSYYKDGLKQGEGKHWMPSGQLAQRVHYVDGKLHGMWTSWHENGQMKDEGKYDQDQKVGEWKYWDDQGNLIRTTDHGAPK